MRYQLVLLWCLGLTACGEVVTPEYRGEPLATVQGVVENRDGLELPSEVSAYVVWLNAIGSGDARELSASATVEATLPANFSLSLFHEPPAVAFGAAPESREATVAVGSVVVATTQQLTALAEGRPVRGVYGATADTQLVYVPSAGDAADLDEVYDGDPVVPGFNLVTRTDQATTVVSMWTTVVVVGLLDGGSP